MRKLPIQTGNIHFVGIGGIGMSGIADILVNLGYKVSGSDVKENAMTVRLARKGVDITLGHRKENVRGSSVVVVSSAISQDNPELLEARRLKIPVVKRAEMLAELMKMKMSIAVAGTHGKTTTTSLIAAMLDQAAMDPTVINGGVINAYNSNARLGAGGWIVVEADESDGSFTRLAATIAVITNMDFDHTSNFKDYDELRGLFGKYVDNIPFYGAAVLCIDHPEVKKLASEIIDRKVITYGFSKDADVSCANMSLSENGAEFDVVFSKNVIEKYGIDLAGGWKRFTLSMHGEHNVQNALSAICVGLELGISEEDMKVALGSFSGVRRRFTRVADVNGVRIIDDYAHHPVEVQAVLKAARHVCRGKVYAVMQAHRYSRLKSFLPEFVDSLQFSDYVIVTPIYSAGEANNGVDHFSLLRELEAKDGVKSEFAYDVLAARDILKEKVQPGDFVIFLGAGDITQWAYKMADLLSE